MVYQYGQVCYGGLLLVNPECNLRYYNKSGFQAVFGISRNIPTDVDITVLGSQHGIKDAKRLDLSKSVKLKFLYSFAQSMFFKYGLRVGYKIFPVYEF